MLDYYYKQHILASWFPKPWPELLSTPPTVARFVMSGFLWSNLTALLIHKYPPPPKNSVYDPENGIFSPLFTARHGTVRF